MITKETHEECTQDYLAALEAGGIPFKIVTLVEKSHDGQWTTEVKLGFATYIYIVGTTAMFYRAGGKISGVRHQHGFEQRIVERALEAVTSPN